VVGHQNPLLPPDAALRAGGLPLQKMTSSYLFLKPYSCSAYEGATGTFLWTEKTGYQAPSAGFTPGLGSTLFGSQLFLPDIAGRGVSARQSRFCSRPQFRGGRSGHEVGMANSEDGKLYRWDLTTNTPFERIELSGGIGEAYTPTLIARNGTVYGINDPVLSPLGK
jgi:hypothetical protein